MPTRPTNRRSVRFHGRRGKQGRPNFYDSEWPRKNTKHAKCFVTQDLFCGFCVLSRNYAKIPRRKTGSHPRRPARRQGFHPRRRQGRRHGARPRRHRPVHRRMAASRSLQEYRDQIEQIVAQGLVDIMLMSAHTNEILTIQKRIFDQSHVTPAARANDTTDIHVMRGGRSPTQPALPFRTATHRSHPVRASRLRGQTNGISAPTSGFTASPFRTTTSSTARPWSATRNFASRPNARAFAISWNSSTRIVPESLDAEQDSRFHQ